MLKKTTLVAIGLAVSGFATAGSMGPVCAPGNYFNGLQTQGLAGFTGSLTTSNYGLYGPYLGLKYVGNV